MFYAAFTALCVAFISLVAEQRCDDESGYPTFIIEHKGDSNFGTSRPLSIGRMPSIAAKVSLVACSVSHDEKRDGGDEADDGGDAAVAL